MVFAEPAGPLLAQWQNFYVIIGSSAGALTGLQFVVIALIADMEELPGMTEVRAFGTPTVVHFCVALLVSAILSAPWPAFYGAELALGICGAAGIAYAVRVIRHATRVTIYKIEAADWVWYAALPLVAYGVLLAAAILLAWHRAWSLFLIAATTLLLLFIGIHNAWDAVTYAVIAGRGQESKKDAKEK